MKFASWTQRRKAEAHFSVVDEVEDNWSDTDDSWIDGAEKPSSPAALRDSRSDKVVCSGDSSVQDELLNDI